MTIDDEAIQAAFRRREQREERRQDWTDAVLLILAWAPAAAMAAVVGLTIARELTAALGN